MLPVDTDTGTGTDMETIVITGPATGAARGAGTRALPAALAILMLLPALAGCGTYDARFDYDPKIEHAHTIEIRMRVENNSLHAFTVDPAEFRLFSGDLQPFPPPHVEPDDASFEIERGDAVTLTAFFPLHGEWPGGDPDLGGLSLRWSIRWYDGTVTESVTFTRERLRAHWHYPGGHWGSTWVCRYY
jgi:hypothetical protein